MAEQNQGTKRRRRMLPGGSDKSKVEHKIMPKPKKMKKEENTVPASFTMTDGLQLLLDALKRAMSRLEERMKHYAEAKDADQLTQVKELYVAMVEIIARKWAILDDTPEIIQNKTVTIRGKAITNADDGYPRIDQTCKFFKEQGFKEDPAYTFDRAVALYMSRRDVLIGNGVDVGGEVKSYLEVQRKESPLTLVKDEAASDRAIKHIEQYIQRKGKLYNEISDIYEYLDELNLLMVPNRRHRKFHNMGTGEFLQLFETACIDLARYNALNVHINKFRDRPSSLSFLALRLLNLITTPPATFKRSCLRTAVSTYRNLTKMLGEKAATEKATETQSYLQKHAEVFRVTVDDMKLAISQFKEKESEKETTESGNTSEPELGHA